MEFKDYFSRQAVDYAAYRPSYPPKLLAWIAQQCSGRELAWDCATGNGQAAIALTPHFQQIIATGASTAQLQQAPDHPQVTYRVAIAESSGLPTSSADLVTVAQAIHWFDLSQFYPEVQRVLKPEGIFAIWCYGRPQLEATALEALLEEYYSHTLEDFWTPERQLVESGYRTLPLPFQELAAPQFRMQTSWTLPELIGYLFTWSATQRFIAKHQYNPLDDLFQKLEQVWPQSANDSMEYRLLISWPLSLRVGRCAAA